MRSSLAVLVAFGVGGPVAGGCEPEVGAGTGPCGRTRDCPSGTICDLRVAQCVAEPEDGVYGTFECIIFEGELGDSGRSEIAAQFSVPSADPDDEPRADRWFLSDAAFCSVVESPGGSELVLYFWRQTDGLPGVTVSLSYDPSKRSFQVGMPESPYDTGSAHFDYTFENARQDLAISTSGSVDLDADPVVGARVRGFVDIGLQGLRPVTRPDVACDGLADCGQLAVAGESAAGGRTCGTFQGETARKCRVSCSSDAQCALLYSNTACSADGACYTLPEESD